MQRTAFTLARQQQPAEDDERRRARQTGGEAARRRQNPFGEPLPRLGPSAAVVSSSRYKTPRGRRSVAPSRRFVSPHATPDTTRHAQVSPAGWLHKR